MLRGFFVIFLLCMIAMRRRPRLSRAEKHKAAVGNFP